MWQFWLIASGVFFIAEIFTLGFLIFWLGVAAIITMCVSIFTDSILIQTAVFVVSSIILIFATKPFVNKFADNKNSIKTNVDAVVGKNGIVVEDIDSINSTGKVKVSGETWSATGLENINIKKGQTITVMDVNGVKAVVKPL